MHFADHPLHILKTPGAITCSATGLALSPTLDGKGLASLDDVDGPWLRHTTASATAASAGLITTLDVTAAQWRPKAEFVVRTAPASELARARYWIGLFEARPDELTPASAGVRMAAFHFDGGANGLAPWRIVVSSGGAPVQATLGGNATGDAVHRLVVDVQEEKVEFTLDDGLAAPQAQSLAVVPGTSQLLGLGVRVTATTTVPRAIRWQRVSWTPFF